MVPALFWPEASQGDLLDGEPFRPMHIYRDRTLRVYWGVLV